MNLAVGLGHQTAEPRLVRDALFRPMGVESVNARTAIYEMVIKAIAALVSRHRNPDFEVLRFPQGIVLVDGNGSRITSDFRVQDRAGE